MLWYDEQRIDGWVAELKKCEAQIGDLRARQGVLINELNRPAAQSLSRAAFNSSRNASSRAAPNLSRSYINPKSPLRPQSTEPA